jgi:type II secretory pathway pseudopilin PulG
MVRRRQEEGFALLLTLVVILFVSFALALLALGLQVRMRLVRQEQQALRLNALSDAVLAETLASLTYAADFPGVEEQDYEGGRIASSVRTLGPNRYEVLATASYAGKVRAVAAEVVRAADGARVTHWERAVGGGS